MTLEDIMLNEINQATNTVPNTGLLQSSQIQRQEVRMVTRVGGANRGS